MCQESGIIIKKTGDFGAARVTKIVISVVRKMNSLTFFLAR